MTDSEITQYLSRIKIDACNADLAGLMKLQEQHTENIPFENLDIVVGREISLDYHRLFEKIIRKNRGGYCFESNILYAKLLKALGFSPQPVLGRVWLSNPKRIPPRNHLAYLVELDGKTYLTDVGFGGLITRIPLDINLSSPVHDKDGLMRVVQLNEREFMVQRQNEKGWANQYSFENIEISRRDIEISHYYMSTNPESHLYYHKCIGRNTKEGRIGLFNNKMSTRKGIKVVKKKRVEFGDEWLEIIKNDFSIDLDFSEEELRTLFEKGENQDSF
jgi:N-hydroxyarylamine O-acetyltransferase